MLHVSVYCVSVVVRAVPPVAVHSCVPPVLFRNNFALGKLATFVEVTFIQTLNVTVEPPRIAPCVPGTPVVVGNCWTMNSPGLRFLMSCELSVIGVVLGAAVLNEKAPEMSRE